ncbi:MAG: hypothetical protein DRI44_09090 [Chlamydiae bacterium]|nr:MAG: hypothetical protein DRI44_09090 [Chlamydiota bacterium]
MESHKEKIILDKCRNGDYAAFNHLVSCYNDRAYYYALSIFHNHHDAMDIAQESFVKAFRAITTFDMTKPFLPWLLRIVRNTCFNELKKKKRRAESPGVKDDYIVLERIPSNTKQPYEIIEENELAASIKNAMTKLPETQKETIFLFHFENLSYGEIAEVTGVPVGTVMSRLFNGRKRLAELLK